MTSIRKQIIDKIEERLRTLQSIHPSWPSLINFYDNPFYPISPEELPGCKIALMSGNSQEYNNEIKLRHDEILVIVYQVKTDPDSKITDRLYKALQDIYDFLIKDHNNPADPDSLYHLLNRFQYSGYDMDLKTGGENIGTVVIKFDVQFYSDHVLDLPDLEEIHTEIKLDGTEDDNNISSIAKNQITYD